MKRFYALEGRFAQQPELKQEYVKFMEQYKALTHISLIEEDGLREYLFAASSHYKERTKKE